MNFSCELVVITLKKKKFPAQMNRNRFDLILARRYWNCPTMENLWERSSLMPGTRAEGNCPGYENCSSFSRGMKSIGRPRLGYENLFNNSSKRLWGTKTARQCFIG